MVMHNKIRNAIIAFILLLIPLDLFAYWDGPYEVLNGSWGDDPNEFGFKSGDIIDQFPKQFNVLSDGKIIIEDWINNRIKVYGSSGNLMHNIIQPGIGIRELDSDSIICFSWDIKSKKWKIGVYS